MEQSVKRNAGLTVTVTRTRVYYKKKNILRAIISSFRSLQLLNHLIDIILLVIFGVWKTLKELRRFISKLFIDVFLGLVLIFLNS